MNIAVLIVLVFSLVIPVFSDYNFPDNWETVTHEGFSWEDYKFDSRGETIVVLFRSRDCMGCIRKVMDNLSIDKKNFVGITGYIKESELFGINTVLKGYRHKILLDKKFSIIRGLKLRKTPVILILNSKLEYRFPEDKFQKKYIED